MDDFKALSTFPNHPRIWLRYVDDIFVAHKAEHIQQFLIHLNSLDPQIRFTTEAPNQQGSLPFLDALVLVGTNESLVTTVYRDPTHRSVSTLGQPAEHHQQILVSLTHSYIGPRLFAQTNNYWDKNNNISRQPLAGVITLAGSFTDLKLNWTISRVYSTTTTTLILIRTPTKPRMSS